ncbi:MAG: 3-oxoacyl-[acyl-carrier-protein] reductase [Chlamydiae bacterium CG10_big_fil_rev_8_21_14_0_10_42_34]|nr:MAG: 3-oxoacyl-[acyl-carrier-protein] reductase [Chlamydiae bacterium CG10_big_fil_rev_8_21_14_0_10_42_34]
MQLLKGKTAIITGGTAGIGKAIACLYAQAGADVIIFGTNQSRADQAIEEIQQSRSNSEQKAISFLLDVSKTKEVDEAIASILKDFGKVDILVNNAGITRDGLLMKMSEEDWDLVIDVNLKSVYNTCRALSRPMMKARSGCIINISSVIGLTGNAGQVNYAASKSGMIGLTKSLAKEFASRGIRANCIAPGYIETQMTDALAPAVKEAIIAKVPLARIGQPLDIANAALYLASDLASYVTGQVLTVDGGMVI